MSDAESVTFILDIEWDRPSSSSPVLPPLVGPFATRSEAGEWAALNIPNGSYECRPVAYPYLRTSVTSPAETRAESDPHATNGRVPTAQNADGDGAGA